ncbi:MAG TPA: GAF domain-containing protein [Polyangiaceae bacterium]|nr:GAF domain-containing protein [Polyangiaceae bacterium]
MGIRGQRYFEEANQLGGLVAKMRLASLSQVTSAEASTRGDSPELIQKLETALNLVRSEFMMVPDKPAAILAGAVRTPTPATLDMLRGHLNVLLDLFSQRGLFAGNLEATVRRITESAASTLGIERVSVWLLDAPLSQSLHERTLVCADLFERTPAHHSAGTRLNAADFPSYFQSLVSERTIAAHDAHTDPRTACFSAVYLTPLGIGAMLDVPIWASGGMVGVLCHEHLGGTRRWTEDEETFAYFLSNLVTLTLEQRALTNAHTGETSLTTATDGERPRAEAAAGALQPEAAQ